MNLPFENTKKVFQFYDLEETVPVRIYLITEAEDLNASGFRIDEMGTADDLMTNEAAVAAKINAQASEQWTYVNAHLGEVAAAKEKAAAAFKAKQAAAKKTPAKKTTAKRTTTRRKATARKATTAAKKTTTAAAKRTTTAKKPTTAATKRSTAAKKTTTTRRTTAAKKSTN
ncbi:DNA-binding protein HU [Agrilactobacillus composti DSM 18527 = JCM 14202]|nr:DNA-binding protein HU [Agrilactobacillus composti DSM 18527 = JCM 14202]